MSVKKIIGRVIIGVSTVLLIVTASSVAMPPSWGEAVQTSLMNLFSTNQYGAQVAFVLIIVILFFVLFFFGCFGKSLFDAAESEEKETK